MKTSERIDRALSVINSCSTVQTEPKTYVALVEAIGDLLVARSETQAMEALDVRAACFVADTPVTPDFHEELMTLFSGTATADREEYVA